MKITAAGLKEFTLNHLDAITVMAGIALASYGAWMAWPPLGFIGAGAALIWIGYPE